MASRKAPGPKDFEAAYKRLEETVARLEEGGLTLEQSLALYKEGMKLAQRCQELLGQAELKVTKLQEEFAALREEPEPYAAEEEEEIPPE
jgi:exodeoxyribonuclease VII small subunit